MQHAHTLMGARAQIVAHWIYKTLFIHNLNKQQRLEAAEDGKAERKRWQLYYFGQRNVLRLGPKESREGFCRRGRGRSFHVEAPNIILKKHPKKPQEPTVESLARGIWRLRVSEVDRRVRDGVWTWQPEIRRSSARNTFIAESVYVVPNSSWDWEPV